MKKTVILAALSLLAVSGMAAAQVQMPAIATTPVAVPDKAPAPQVPANAAGGNDWMTYHNPYAGEQTNLANPHRTSEEVLAWAQKNVTYAMTLAPDTLTGQLTAVKNSFSDAGWAAYAGYMRDAKIVETVRDQRYSMTSIVNGDPQIVNSGTVSGAYRWLVEMPLLITFLATDPATGDSVPMGGGNYRLVVQIGRIASASYADGLAIESWQIKPVR